jgi:ornithine--oxo-acid transaminase
MSADKRARFDVAALLEAARGRAARSYPAHLNPAYATMVETLGFHREYVRGEGPYLWEAGGRQVLDCLAGYGAIAIGRNHPVVVDALRQCLDLAIPAWVRWELNPLAAEAAGRLKRCCGGAVEHVFFTNSGTEGIEAAIKFARRHTGRPGLVAWSDSFHGLTCGALALNGNEELRRGFEPLVPEAHVVEFGDLAAVERLFDSGTIAAMVVEPVQGKTLRALDPATYRDLHALCRSEGVLLVADEVQTGGGRTGRFLASHLADVSPDIVVLSKALCGGFVPVGAVLVRSDVWRSTFSSMERAIVHSSTFHEGPMAMVALMATLHVIESEELMGRARTLGAMLADRLRAACAEISCVREVRGTGLMVGIEIDPDRVPNLSKVPLIGSSVGSWTTPLIGQGAVMTLLRDHAVLAQTTGARRPFLKLLPPMVIRESDVDWIANACSATLRTLGVGGIFPSLGRVAANGVIRVGRRLLRRDSEET